MFEDRAPAVPMFKCHRKSSKGVVRVWPRPAAKGHAAALLPLPPLGWGGGLEEKAKPVGWDKGSLTERQRKWAVLVRTKEYTEWLAHHLTPNTLPSHDSPPPGQLPHSAPSRTAHGIQWPLHLASLGQLPSCVPSQLLVKVNPIPAQPRTAVGLGMLIVSMLSISKTKILAWPFL